MPDTKKWVSKVCSCVILHNFYIIKNP